MARLRLVLSAALVLLLAAPVMAQTPSHPLSHISPTDTDFNFSNNANNNGYDIVGLPAITPRSGTLTLRGDLDLGSNALAGYYEAGCPAGEAVQDVFDNGTFVCVSTGGGGGVDDVWVNETGDDMTGPLNMTGHNITWIGQGRIDIGDTDGDLQMNGNRLEGLGAYDSGDDAMRRDGIVAEFVEEAGDRMDGKLTIGPFDLGHVELQSSNSDYGWELETVDLGGGTVPLNISRKQGGSYLPTLKLRQSGDLELLEGNLDLTDNNILGANLIEATNNENLFIRPGSNSNTINLQDAGGTNVLQVNAGGTDAVAVPNGDLDVQGNNITNSQGGNVSVGDSLQVYGNVWATGADLAELYHSTDDLDAGELVAISATRDEAVSRTTRAYQETATGVVSTAPSYVMNRGGGDTPVALEGKAPVRVSTVNGAISRGDRIVPSPTPGVGMRCELVDPTATDTDLRAVIAHNQRCRASTIGRAMAPADENTTIPVKLG